MVYYMVYVYFGLIVLKRLLTITPSPHDDIVVW